MTNTKNVVTQPRTIKVAGYTAKINVKFTTYGNGRWYASVSETAKAVKAIATAAGFTVLGCKSQSYSGGDNVNLIVKTELTPEQIAKNDEIRSDNVNWYRRNYDMIKEPRAKLLDEIEFAFKDGHFDGMTDCYNYKEKVTQVEAPEGNEKVDITAKYIFWKTE